MADVVLHYSASVYRTKIEKFESLNNQLGNKRDLLGNLKDEIKDFYNSEQAREYILAISRAITRVDRASDNVKSLSRQYGETMDELDRVGGAVDTIQSDIERAVDKTIDVAKVAVDVLPL